MAPGSGGRFFPIAAERAFALPLLGASNILLHACYHPMQGGTDDTNYAHFAFFLSLRLMLACRMHKHVPEAPALGMLVC